MKAVTTLNLVNKESGNIFSKVIGQERLFIVAIVSRVSNLINDALFGKVIALIESYKINLSINKLSEHFYDEIDRFEGLLERRNGLDPSKVKFIAQYKHDISCSSEITINISNLIEVFDKLVSTVKLVHLSGGFDSQASFYAVKQKIQKKMNALLSSIMQTKSTKNSEVNVNDFLKNSSDKLFEIEGEDNLEALIKAMNSSYAPGLSAQNRSQITFRLKQLKKGRENELLIKNASLKLKELQKSRSVDIKIMEKS